MQDRVLLLIRIHVKLKKLLEKAKKEHSVSHAKLCEIALEKIFKEMGYIKTKNISQLRDL